MVETREEAGNPKIRQSRPGSESSKIPSQEQEEGKVKVRQQEGGAGRAEKPAAGGGGEAERDHHHQESLLQKGTRDGVADQNGKIQLPLQERDAPQNRREGLQEREARQNGGTAPGRTQVNGADAEDGRRKQPVNKAVEAILQKDRRVVEEGEDGALPPELAEEAEWDIHEKPKWVERDVQALREMVEAEAGLISRLDTPFLLAFLRARKFDYDKAMGMIRSYYKSRQENAEMYVNLVPSALDHVWPLKMQTVLPTPDALGRTVIIFRTGSWLPEVCGLDDVFRSQVMILEHIVRVPVTQLRGVAAVVDCAGLSMTHAYYLTPTHIRRMISVIQEVFPLRFKALHFVNEPSIFDWVFSLIKPFLSETIKGRLHFHGEDLNALHQHVPPHNLPEELGGNGGPMDNSCLVENLKKHEEYFTEHFKYGFETCEEPGRAGTVMEAVGDMGSLIGSYYRRMCID